MASGRDLLVFALLSTPLAVQAGSPPPPAPAAAADPWRELPPQKRTKLGLYMTPKQAAEAKQRGGDKVLFVDVRTRGEAMFVGMARDVDALIPFKELPATDAQWEEAKSTYALQRNPDFVNELKRRLAAKGLLPTDTVILMCRSGDRSAMAADVLAEQGFTRVYSVAEGFEGDPAKEGEKAGQRVVNGWKNAALPWGYKLDRAKLYFPSK